MRTERFMYFCIKIYIGTQGEVWTVKGLLTTATPPPPQLPTQPPPPVVYITDRSKAVVPMLFLFCVAL